MTHQDQDYEHIKTRGCETPDYVNTESSSPRLRTMNTSRPAREREREREREKERERERERQRERESFHEELYSKITHTPNPV